MFVVNFLSVLVENLTEIMVVTHEKLARQEINKKGKKVITIQVRNIMCGGRPCFESTKLML